MVDDNSTMANKYHHCVFIPRLGLSVFRSKGNSKARRLHMIHDGPPEILSTYATFPAGSTGCRVALLLKLRSLQITYDEDPAWFDWHRLHDVQAANRTPCSLEILKMNSAIRLMSRVFAPISNEGLSSQGQGDPRRLSSTFLTSSVAVGSAALAQSGVTIDDWQSFASMSWASTGWHSVGILFGWLGWCGWEKLPRNTIRICSHPCQNTQIYGCVGEYGCMVYLYNQDILWVSCFCHVWTNLNFNMPLYLMAGHNMSHHSAPALLCTSMITTQELKTKQPNKHPSTILYSGWWVCSHFRTSPNVDCYRHPKTFMQGEVNTAFTNMIVPGRRLFPLFPGDHTAVKARLIIFANLGSNGTFCKHCDSNNGPRSSRTFVLKNGFMNQSLSLHGLLAGVRGNSLRMLKEILSNNTTKCFRNK